MDGFVPTDLARRLSEFIGLDADLCALLLAEMRAIVGPKEAAPVKSTASAVEDRANRLFGGAP